ncbi:MAG TPA: peptide-methionine (S)-S-oxide reductase MsrA [Candidatus Saccharimonadales bacterium]|nr:peptide-methionine (S)-S-oxide reductase MsrA [Candidatus Saccharimonadales bacterium]
MQELATIAGGCFWCTEAIFKRLKGVESATPGYSGGNLENPTYEQVCSETTGHAEAIQIKFDPKIISYETLLTVFFKLHDPTTLNRQGNDVGTSYRSAIFYHSEDQKKTAEKVKAKMQKLYKEKIVTEIVPYKNFYEAENYHKNYFDNNKNQPYCQLIIDPKITKLYREFESITK